MEIYLLFSYVSSKRFEVNRVHILPYIMYHMIFIDMCINKAFKYHLKTDEDLELSSSNIH